MSNEIPVKQVDPNGDSSNNKKKPETVDLYASRQKIYVKEVKGFFQRIRNVSLTLLMGMYFLFVWLTLDGQPLIHFDLPAREFHLYGITFFPKDFFLLSGMLSFQRSVCFSSPPCSAGYGAAIPAPRQSGPLSSCGSRKKLRAAATSG